VRCHFRITASAFLAVVLAILSAGTAQAIQIPTLNGAGLSINCTPVGGLPCVSALSIPPSDITAINNLLQANGLASWTLPAPLTIYDSNSQPLAIINSLKVSWDRDPQVSLEFSVQNMTNSAATITLNSTIQTVSLTNPQGYATAGLTLTDINHDGGTLTGSFTGGKAYRAYYNGTLDFANLVSSFTTLANKTSVGNEDSPVGPGMTTVPSSVTEIASTFSFDLSAQDQASGTSTFYLTPEPATLTLLAAGGLLMMRRRRR
jgi:hypothetical protein